MKKLAAADVKVSRVMTKNLITVSVGSMVEDAVKKMIDFDVECLPVVGYLTLADRMMLSVYAIFLYNLSVSVYLMRLVDAKKTEEAQKFNKKASKLLAVLIIALIMIQLFA